MKNPLDFFFVELFWKMSEGIPELPDAVFACVAGFCDRDTLCNLACTCKRVHDICVAECGMRTRSLRWNMDVPFGNWICDLPDASSLCQVALVGPHNSGKTTLINAYSQVLEKVESGLAELDQGALDDLAKKEHIPTEFPCRCVCATRAFGKQLPLTVWGLLHDIIACLLSLSSGTHRSPVVVHFLRFDSFLY